MVYLRAERGFILEHYFASKLFAAFREVFSSTYPDKEVPKKTTVHRQVTAFRDTGSVLQQGTFAVKLFCKFFLTNKN
jgi:hypothetical protein